MNGAESVSNKEMESVVYLISHSNDTESDNPPPTPPPPPPTHFAQPSHVNTATSWPLHTIHVPT